jgi:hypothetical protein
MCSACLDDAQQKQNEHNYEDEADATTALVTQPGAHAVSAEAKSEDQHNEKNDQHSFNLLRSLIYGSGLDDAHATYFGRA